MFLLKSLVGHFFDLLIKKYLTNWILYIEYWICRTSYYFEIEYGICRSNIEDLEIEYRLELVIRPADHILISISNIWFAVRISISRLKTWSVDRLLVIWSTDRKVQSTDWIQFVWCFSLKIKEHRKNLLLLK